MKKKKTTSVVKESLTIATGEQVIIYTDEKGNTELRMDIKNETAWATQDQMAVIFDTTKQNIGQHIKGIFSSVELMLHSVVKDFFTTASDGKQYLTKFYNLDAVIAVGYRVNSKKATQFRIWVTKILREYIVRGYNLNNQRILNSPEKIEGLRQAIALIESNENPGKMKGIITFKLTKDLK